jgi:hypothetical protein
MDKGMESIINELHIGGLKNVGKTRAGCHSTPLSSIPLFLPVDAKRKSRRFASAFSFW